MKKKKVKKQKKGLSNKTISEIQNTVFPYLMDGMFGDGCERDYIVDGFTFKGLANMTDRELIQEMEACGFDDIEEGEEYELLQRARAELKGKKKCPIKKR